MAPPRARLALVVSCACLTQARGHRASIHDALAHDESRTRGASFGLDTPGGDYSGLLLGTMNVIGNDENPFQFYPSDADMKLSLGEGGVEAWRAAYAGAIAAFEKYTVAEALAQVQAQSEEPAKEPASTLSTFLDTLSAEARSKPVLSLVKDGTLDLGLDNKWDDGDRVNPIVQAMGPMPGKPDVPKVTAVSQPDVDDAAAIAAYFKARIGKKDVKLWASLLLWDMLCTDVAKQAPEQLATLAKVSYMNNAKNLLGAKPDILTDLFAPLAQQAGEHPKAMVIVGGQEIPKDDSFADFVARKGLALFRKPAQMAGTDDKTVSGFFHSQALKAADVTASIEGGLRATLGELGLKADIIDTTLRKMLVTAFSKAGKPYATVIVFHCKSFKKDVQKQAAFVAKAFTLAEALGHGPVYAVGDMNVEAKFPKDYTVADAKQAVKNAPFGMMPKDTAALTEKFTTALETDGIQPYPTAAETMTTLKIRTALQGQPGKADEVTVAHKDFVFVRKAGTVVSGALVGGRREQDEDGNLALLQPSRQWPSDHFAIMAFVDQPADV